MANVTVKIDFKGIDDGLKKKILNPATARILSKVVGKEIVSFLDRGQSPVAKVPRFQAYAAQRASSNEKNRLTEKAGRLRGSGGAERRKVINKKAKAAGSGKYPDMYKNIGKRRRPVNLNLFGGLHDFILDAEKFMTWTKKNGVGYVVLGFDKADKKLKDIVEAHNEGTLTRQNVPKRKFIPNKRGDKFKAAINRRIRGIFATRVRALIKEINSKS